jgi:hypothetical protein
VEVEALFEKVLQLPEAACARGHTKSVAIPTVRASDTIMRGSLPTRDRRPGDEIWPDIAITGWCVFMGGECETQRQFSNLLTSKTREQALQIEKDDKEQVNHSPDTRNGCDGAP